MSKEKQPKGAYREDGSSDEPKKEKLEMQPYYHGIREREDILHELRYPGDFIVRARAFQDTAKIILNVMGQHGPWNLTFDWLAEEKKYMLHIARNCPDQPISENIVDLINHYRKHPIPDGPKLKYGVPRPKWLLRTQNIEYNPDKDLLGSGNFCSVYRGTLAMEGQRRRVAIKVCHPPDTDTKPGDLEEAVHSMLYEAKIMSKYSHDNVIEFCGVFCDHLPIRIVLEFCPGGALDSHLKEREIGMLELSLYAFEAARGMRYLHQQKCIHRDLAARNCLISARGIVKIADFGLSKIVDEMQKEEKVLKHIPLRWMAPETIRKPPQYLTNSDVWSYGVLLYELFNKGVAVFAEEKEYKRIAKAIRSVQMPKFPDGTPPVIEKLVTEDIWVKEPEKRMNFTDIVPILYHFLEENLVGFPSDIKTLAVNQIKGVRRTEIFYGTKQELLKVERQLPRSHVRRRMVRRRRNESREEDERGTKSKALGMNKQKKKSTQSIQQSMESQHSSSGQDLGHTKPKTRTLGRVVSRLNSRFSDNKENNNSRFFGRRKRSKDEDEKSLPPHPLSQHESKDQKDSTN